jgi:PilZ domain
MREFIRHPADVPIQIQSARDRGFENRSTQNVSFGGLAFSSATAIEPETFITLRLPYLQPLFEVAAARVAWCRNEGSQYVIGVQFPDSEEAFRVRMVEQLLHIETYRREVAEREGRQLTMEEAAREWISRYAASFPNP